MSLTLVGEALYTNLDSKRGTEATNKPLLDSMGLIYRALRWMTGTLHQNISHSWVSAEHSSTWSLLKESGAKWVNVATVSGRQLYVVKSTARLT